MKENYFGSSLRRRIVFIVIVGMISIQTFQLVKMQLLESNKYEEKSKDNSIKTVQINAPRGILFDRNLEILVGNKPSFTLQITPDLYDTSNSKIIESIINVKSGYIKKLLDQYRNFSKYKPTNLMRGVNYNVISWFEENHSKLPGLDYIVETQRDYSFGVNASHVFGYTKEIGREALKKSDDFYSIGDNVGFSGIEKEYEKYLRGNKGNEFLVVNSSQKIVYRHNEGKSDIPAIKGSDVVLTLDYQTQKTAEELMKEYKGVAIAVDPANGEILAYISTPQFDLSDFADITSNTLWDSLRNDPSKPLFNRGTLSMYSPGSTFKMLVAIAALEEGILDTTYSVNCNGGLQFGNRFFKCTHFHGKVDMKEAIEESCNTYFYKVVLKLGIDKLSKYAKMFHLGMKTNIDISPESSGLIASREYYDKVYGKGKWSDGNLLSIGIGQGEIITTPIQLVQYTALLANNGVTKVPHFGKGYIDSKTNEFVSFHYDSIKTNVSEKTFKFIREAMEGVVSSAKGTGRNIKLPNISISGKTGTAQNPHGKDHSIFIAFAPSNNPKIAVAVIVENVGYGSTYAAPMAQKIIKAYLEKDKKKDDDLLKINNEASN
ncbi:MAG: penicillin-binding protein 2 [Bacteroidetes bacterium]|nr:penicillin-binding protein 2 [Bacteroidota bacterium]MBU1116292.1 penicillin-binding protein 2 [Bacteroidota bacterium]MBU1797140.1 penicillin-binding protein 2 [Bacteroidota bacterium]